MNRDIQYDRDDARDELDCEIPDDVCKVCAGTGYVLNFRSSRRQVCPDCYQDNGPDEPRDESMEGAWRRAHGIDDKR